MADFHSFREFAESIQGGFQRIGKGHGMRGVAKATARDSAFVYEALDRAGNRLVAEFREIIYEQGRGAWPPLDESTLFERARLGLYGSDMLFVSGELAEGITHLSSTKFNGNPSVEVGMKDKMHVHPDEGGQISLEGLMLIHDQGSPASWHGHSTEVPARPVFSHPDFPMIERKVVAMFVAEVLGDKLAGRFARAKGAPPFKTHAQGAIKWLKP